MENLSKNENSISFILLFTLIFSKILQNEKAPLYLNTVGIAFLQKGK